MTDPKTIVENNDSYNLTAIACGPQARASICHGLGARGAGNSKQSDTPKGKVSFKETPNVRMIPGVEGTYNTREHSDTYVNTEARRRLRPDRVHVLEQSRRGLTVLTDDIEARRIAFDQAEEAGIVVEDDILDAWQRDYARQISLKIASGATASPVTHGDWLLDSGASNHMVSLGSLDEGAPGRVRIVDDPVVTNTANGQVVVDKRIDVLIPDLDIIVDPLIFEDTPSALAMGRLCEEGPFEFVWRNKSGKPTLTNVETGISTIHKIKGFVPVTRGNTGKVSGINLVNRFEILNEDADFSNVGIDDFDSILMCVPVDDPYGTSAASLSGPTVSNGSCHERGCRRCGKSLAAAGAVDPETPNNDDEVEEAAPSREDKLREEAKSLRHQMTHIPKNPYCSACVRAKVVQKQARRKRRNENRKARRGEEEDPPPTKFGDLITADGVVLNSLKDVGVSEYGDMHHATVIKDVATKWRMFAPTGNKSASEARKALSDFVGTNPVGRFHSDNAGDLLKAALDKGWVHDTSAPYRHEENSIAEREVGIEKEGVRANLVQAGLPPIYWPLAGPHFAFSLNIEEPLEDGMSPWASRHRGQPFWGLKIPFGGLCHFRPVQPKRDLMPEFAPRGTPGIFLGWFLLPGGRWKGDYLVADLDDFRKGKKIHVQRVKEVVVDEGPTQYPLRAEHDKITCTVDPDSVVGSYPDETLLLEEDNLPSKTASSSASPHPMGDGGHPPDEGEVIRDESSGDSWARPTKCPGCSSNRSKCNPLHNRVPGVCKVPLSESRYWDCPGCREILGGLPRDHEMHSRLHGECYWAGAQFRGVSAIRVDDLPNNNNEESMVSSLSNRIQKDHERILSEVVDQEIADGLNPELSPAPDATGLTSWGALAQAQGLSAHDSNDDKVIPQQHTATIPNRKVVELCCGKDSRFCKAKWEKEGCEVVRFTEDQDLTLNLNVEKALREVRHDNVLVAIAVPCTGGSQMQRSNNWRPGAAQRMHRHKQLFTKLMTNIIVICREAKKYGARIVLEWPKGCSYWNDPTVIRFMMEHELVPTYVDGCAVGLKSVKNGLPVLKPWTFATNDVHIWGALQDKRCPGKETHPKHQRCNGSDAKASESYTDELVEVVHRAFEETTKARNKLEEFMTLQMERQEQLKKELHENFVAASAQAVAAPLMPTDVGKPVEHRPKRIDYDQWYNALVSRSVPRSEVRTNKLAQEALRAEANKLRSAKTWLEDTVMEKSDVRAKAQAEGRTVHFAELMAICVVKDSELEEALQKYKGRIVVRGDIIKDEYGRAAMFKELGSAPASMCAGKIGDAWGLARGHTTEQADAEQAYIQCELQGDETWVSLPPEIRPASWAKYRNPVCRLRLSLYGHPDAGGYWEKHCEEQLLLEGFQPVTDWRSCYWHPELKLVLTVYVDDFKMSGPTNNLVKGWEKIRKRIKLDKVKPSGRYLGCQHVVKDNDAGGEMEYDVGSFMKQCCSRYLEVSGLDESSLTPAATPFLPEESFTEEDETEAGELREDACKVLMKILYGARVARFDLLNATRALASSITKWSRAADKRLHRLVCYISSTLDHTLKGYVGDPLEDLYLRLYADADFAGCPKTSRSTSGVFLCLCGPKTWMPLTAISKKQGCVSHSTPEAELVALDHALRAEGLPALTFWETILGRPVRLVLEEDNQTAITVLKTGYSTALRHMGRTHKVCLRWIHERIVDKEVEVKYCLSKDQSADIFTKGFSEPIKWRAALENISVRPRRIIRKEDPETLRPDAPVVDVAKLGGAAIAASAQSVTTTREDPIHDNMNKSGILQEKSPIKWGVPKGNPHTE